MLSALFTATLALVAGTNAFAVAVPQANKNLKVCPFNATAGPSVLIAVAEIPNRDSEIDAWAYGNGWCTSSQLASKGANFCTGHQIEYLHVPITDKFGHADDPDCYTNFNVEFAGCPKSGNDYTGVKATFTSTSDDSKIVYECKTDRQHHGCVYDGDLRPVSEVQLTAFLSCGIIATP